MQTFLTYPSFSDTARILDTARLGKQRSEAYQILLTLTGESFSWETHPIMDMWDGHEHALAYYGATMCREWIERGHHDNLLPEFYRFMNHKKGALISRPDWCYDPVFHRSHQSNLVRKYPEYYRKFFPEVPDNLPYIWKVKT